MCTGDNEFNFRFAEVLRGKHPLWSDSVSVESTGIFRDLPYLQPDILVHPPHAQPVVVETAHAPAMTVEADAKALLGLVPTQGNDQVEQVIAVCVPPSLSNDQSTSADQILNSTLQYCVFSGEPDSPIRFPLSGWLSGGVDAIVRCIECGLVPRKLIDKSRRVFELGLLTASEAIGEASQQGFVDVERGLGRVLNQREGEQTNRMAMTIIAIALLNHESIAKTNGVPSVLEVVRRQSVQLSLLSAWWDILKKGNHSSIFEIAFHLLARISAQPAEQVLAALIDSASQLATLGITTRHDLAGRMFQNLIIDRKFLATFYTLPTSATLLSELAISRLSADWQDLPSYSDLRIADLSCGTGTLLSAAYHSILTRYRHAGGDHREIYQSMVENVVIAADIMPSAAHLCASQLSCVHPTVLFRNTRVYTMPYGSATTDAPNRDIAIGSLDLIDSDSTTSLFATGHRQASGVQGDLNVRDLNIPQETVDLIIMNPPFTRPTNHKITDVPVPSFAGFQTTEDEQSAMSDRLASIRKSLDRPAGHGNAGLASNFIDLAHAKIKREGVVALVLPIAAIQGASWQAARNLLMREYRDIAVVTIATSGSQKQAFSADTDMAEALVIATKGSSNSLDENDSLFVNLHSRPQNLLEAAEIAKLVTELPFDSITGYIDAGDQSLGTYIRAPLQEGGCAALRETDLAKTMILLRDGTLDMPRLRNRVALPVSPLGELGQRGLLHRDIGSKTEESPPFRGPFTIRPSGGQSSFPMLWNHVAEGERCLIVEPDSEGAVRPDCEDHAKEVWRTATRLHYSLDFGLSSQSVAACLTPNMSLGGRAWPNFAPMRSEWEEVLALWANSTLGMMCFWWAGSRQHQGRSLLTISRLPTLLSLDPRELSDKKIRRAKDIFLAFKDTRLLPANEAYRDDARQAIDRAVLIDLLELPEEVLDALDHLRLQWCAEPSVHGGKSTAPV